MSLSIPQQPAQPHPKKSFWDAINRFTESVPSSEFEKLPADGSTQLDHYIYGVPKLNQ